MGDDQVEDLEKLNDSVKPYIVVDQVIPKHVSANEDIYYDPLVAQQQIFAKPLRPKKNEYKAIRAATSPINSQN